MGRHTIFWDELQECSSRSLVVAEFGGKGDRISKDGLGDEGIGRWGDGENRK